MAVVEKTFAIDENIAIALDKMIDDNEQSKYINEFFMSLIEQKNREAIENMIWHFSDEMPNPNGKSSTDLLREIRDNHYHA
ncbi:MAG: hypothetical protein Q4B79_04440 [Moraxella sp.]|uniref:hypothetical protein n=1 Tax=Moraxella sp. TaxID=479 RepID=UPI0026DB2318|nr:hypothetical protein [Moraxella sp.]MDO4450194.1 hypothetical protein [Moraxella sp.]